MVKEISRVITLQIPAGKANPAPPIGTVLGPTGIDMQQLCQQFNDQTKEMGDTIIPAEITIYEDRSFTFILKSSPAAILLKKAAGISKGSGVPHTEKVASVSWAQIEKIAEEKMRDLSANDLEGAKKIIAGTARSMGIEVKG